MDANNRMFYIAAQDADGAAWNSSEQVEPDLEIDNGFFTSMIDLAGHPGIAHFNNAQGILKFSYRY